MTIFVPIAPASSATRFFGRAGDALALAPGAAVGAALVSFFAAGSGGGSHAARASAIRSP
jgi:hypothetical protein